MNTKAYIGRGTQHNQYDIIDVVLDVEKIQDHIFEYEGRRYLKMSVAKRKEAGKYGSTHTVYVRVKTQEPVADTAADPKPKRKRKA